MKLTAPAVAVVQSGIPSVVLTVAPVQKIRDSGIVPVRTMAVDVLTATIPVSSCVVQAASENVLICTKNAELVVLGLVTLEKLTNWLPLEAVAFEAFTIRSEPGVAVLAVQPEAAPSPVGCEVRLEPVMVKPAGVPTQSVVVQTVNDADFTAVDVGTVNVNAYVVTALGVALPSCSDRAVICAACVGVTLNTDVIDDRTKNALNTTLLEKTPFLKLMCEL